MPLSPIAPKPRHLESARREVRALYRDLELKIQYVPIESVRDYERHARTHSKAQTEAIQASMRAFGFASPVLIDSDAVLIAGHGRVAAAKALGYTTIPAIRLDHLNDAEAACLRLADNRLAELAGWDRPLLALEFRYVEPLTSSLELDFDLSITGFALPEIENILGQASNQAIDDEAFVPELGDHAWPVSQIGDLWRLGDHAIFCGDSSDRTSIAALLGDDRVAAGFHDPPYNVSVTRHVSRSGRHTEFAMGVGEMSAEAFTAFNATWLRFAASVSRPGAVHWTCMDWRHLREMLDAGRDARLALKNLVVWNKGSGAMGSLLRSQHELIFMWAEPNGPVLNNVQLGKYGRNRTNVWDYPGATGLREELKLHPTPKPVALVADALRDVSDRGDLVLDCFSGSGTTIIAAAKTERRARVIELDPRYVDVAIRRYESLTGEKARHAQSGRSFAEVSEANSERPQLSPRLTDPALAAPAGDESSAVNPVAAAGAPAPSVRVRSRLSSSRGQGGGR